MRTLRPIIRLRRALYCSSSALSALIFSSVSIFRAAWNSLVSSSISSLTTLEGLGAVSLLEEVFFFIEFNIDPFESIGDNLLHRGFTRRLRSPSAVSGDLELLLRGLEWLRNALNWSSIDCVDVVHAVMEVRAHLVSEDVSLAVRFKRHFTSKPESDALDALVVR